MQCPFPKNFPNPLPPGAIPPEEDFDKILEWTEEEEEAFLDLLDKQTDKNLPKEKE